MRRPSWPGPKILYPPWGIIFFHFCLYKTQEDINNNIFVKVLMGVENLENAPMQFLVLETGSFLN